MRRNRDSSLAQSRVLEHGDGHNGRDRRGFMNDLFGAGEIASAIKEFVHPGKSPSEVLMRVFFKDERQANAAVLFLRKCDEFHMEGHKTLLLNRLCSSVSVKGTGRNQLLQAVVGQLMAQLNGLRPPKYKRGRDGDED